MAPPGINYYEELTFSDLFKTWEAPFEPRLATSAPLTGGPLQRSLEQSLPWWRHRHRHDHTLHRDSRYFWGIRVRGGWRMIDLLARFWDFSIHRLPAQGVFDSLASAETVPQAIAIPCFWAALGEERAWGEKREREEG